MYHTHNSLYDRCLEKTPEQVFINSLRKEFELSPAESKGVLELAKSCLFGELPQTIGRIKYLCASRQAKHGKPLSDQDKVEVILTLDNGIEDLNVSRESGSIFLRQLKILRISEEAWIQGGTLTQEDLSRILQVSIRTIRNDVKQLLSDGNVVHLRGYDHDIGPSLSHKSHIIELHLQGLTYDAIMQKTRHSAFAIKRYICSFGRLLLLLNHGMTDVTEISRLLGQSKRLTEEYISLFEKYKQGDKWPQVYIELVEQLKMLYPCKAKLAKKKGGNNEE
jgi:hypothetical protein